MQDWITPSVIITIVGLIFSAGKMWNKIQTMEEDVKSLREFRHDYNSHESSRVALLELQVFGKTSTKQGRGKDSD